ncbi:GntR family transcriptional regulator [Azohydromonas caseinilytica]|uniref:GntR family transcriptional regulator n=1 Tax=Azohydromonas caseinilytica TaxID=2728836 RepID=A0A848FF20_9BURK|nr:GntR family transcriptional regulator [Azohydromonas caseinilytica]NML16750.1 GntR family transcriptional regulator [Azohydromonas caseinilytica]
MASQIERVTAELRRRILGGALQPGERVLEVQCSAELGVSRTPLRLALGELEKEGLLERLPRRGFRVRQVTLDEVAMAIDVRGTLEGMAVRLLAEQGASPRTLSELHGCIEQGRQIVQAAVDAGEAVDTVSWATVNARFHRVLAQAAGNPVLVSALEHVAKTPMAGPGALGASGQAAIELSFVQRAQLDHEDIVQAVEAREGARAEALMREHARRSRDNKRILVNAMRGARWAADAVPQPMLA